MDQLSDVVHIPLLAIYIGTGPLSQDDVCWALGRFLLANFNDDCYVSTMSNSEALADPSNEEFI